MTASSTAAPALPEIVEYLGLSVSFLHWEGTKNLMMQCWVQIGDKKKRLRLSAKTDEHEVARMRAGEWLKELVIQTRGEELGIAREVVAAGRALPLEQAFRVYEQEVLDAGKKKDPNYEAAIRLAMQLALKVWKPRTDASAIAQDDVDTFITLRVKGGIRYDGVDKQGNKKPMSTKPVSEATAVVDVKLLRQVFRYLASKRLLASNPLKDNCTLPRIDDDDIARPVMSEARYQLLMGACEEVERRTREHFAYRPGPKRGLVQGALRTFLVLARKTGRRGGAIAGLRVGNVLLTQDRLIAALAARGLDATGVADAWPYGGIIWAPFKDKRRKAAIMPLSKELHDLLVEYLAELKPAGDESPLFPGVTDHARPMTSRYFYRQFTRCEEVCRERGHNMPKIAHGGIHMLRRQRRTELAGRFHDNLVALSIGWKPPRGKYSVMNSVYLQFMQGSPESLYHLAEFDVNTVPPEGALPPGVLVRVPLPPRPARRGD